MGLMDIIKGIGRIPGALNEARYEHETVKVPAAGQPIPQIPAGTNPDDLVTIGFNPDTGEPIQIPQSELGNYNLNVGNGQVMQDKKVRTGRQSGFGQFLSQGLPRMLDAGIAAATSRGDGTGGALAVLKGMDIGSDRLQKRDMLAYQQQRQRMQDQSMMDDRAARAEENRMQAEMYRRRMDGGMGSGGATAKVQRDPTTWEAELVQMHRDAVQAGDMGKANAIADQIKSLSKYADKAKRYQAVGSEIFDMESGTFVPRSDSKPKERPLTADQASKKETVNAANSYLMRAGQDPMKAAALAKEENAPMSVQAQIAAFNRQVSTRPGRAPGGGQGRKPSAGMTTNKADQIENDKAKDLAKAKAAYDSEIKNPATRDGAAKRLIEAQKAAQSRYEQRIKAAGGSITQTWNPEQTAPAAPSTGGNPWDRWK